MAASPWSRPDDAVRQAQLDAMKRQATGLLALAAVVFVGASLYEGRYPWLGYVRATAEASLVGGLADWFAVTALFRHPLGLPIPHTAIVATRKERIGRILGTFVQNHFLSRDVVATNLRAVRPAERAARWLADPEHGRRIARQVASGVAKTLDTLPDADVRALVQQVVSARLQATRVAPTLGKTLALVLVDDRHQGLLNEAVRFAAQAVHDNRDVIRERVRAESPWWVPGVVDDQIYQRIIVTVEGLLRDIGARPDHPLRAAFDTGLRDFVDRLHGRGRGPEGAGAPVRAGRRTGPPVRPHQRHARRRVGRAADLRGLAPLALSRLSAAPAARLAPRPEPGRSSPGPTDPSAISRMPRGRPSRRP